MKKFLSVLLPILPLMFLAACGNSTPSMENEGSPPPQTAPVLVQADHTQEKAAASHALPFAGQVFLDNERCFVQITKIEPDHMWGYTLYATLENRSEDTDYVFSVAGAAINGVQMDPVFSVRTEAGEKSTQTITFNRDALSKHGIAEVTDIQLEIQVYDAEDWVAEAVEDVTEHIYPYGENKAEAFDRNIESTDQILMDTRDMTVIVTGYQKDSTWGYGVDFFVVNKTDEKIVISVENALVNGAMIDPAYTFDLLPETCIFNTMTWSRDALEKNDIQTIREISFTMRVLNDDTPNAEEMLTENILLRP